MSIKLFNNILTYRLGQNAELPGVREMNNQLCEYLVQEPTGAQLKRSGFVEAIEGSGEYASPVPGRLAVMIKVCRLERSIPGAAVRRKVAQKVKQIEQQEDRRVFSREKADIKNEILMDMAPKAPVVDKYVDVMIDPPYIYVDQTNANRAEEVLSLLREALGSLPVRPVSLKDSASSTMTTWLIEDRQIGPTGNISVGQKFKSQSACEESETLSGSLSDLSGQLMQSILEDDHRITSLELKTTLGDMVVPAVLSDNGTGFSLSGIKWPAELVTKIDEWVGEKCGDDRDRIEERRTTFLLVGSAVRQLVEDTIHALGGEELKEGELPAPAMGAFTGAKITLLENDDNGDLL